MVDETEPGRIKITQEDIARRLNVSRATVSAALSGARYVTPALKEKILATAEEIHYVPNSAARSLKTRRSMIIGLALPNILSPVWATIVRSIADVARQSGFSTILYDTDDQPASMKTALRTLEEKQVDGIVLAPCGGCNDELQEILSAKATPVVLVDRHADELQCDSVASDGVAGAYEATKHLLDAGHERVGLIALPLEIAPGRERLAGYHRAMQERGLSRFEDLVRICGRGQTEGHAAAIDLLTMPSSRKPTALVVTSHAMTVGTLFAIRELGLMVPRDVGLIGFDDAPWAPLMAPPLSVVSQPARDMGAKAAELLMDRLIHKDDQREPVHVTLPVNLILRSSCCCAGHGPVAGLDAIEAGSGFHS